VRKNINERDFNDQNRIENPLKKAADAIVIDNSNLSIEQQNQMAITLVQEKLLKT
jgi:cytidylate kinase